MATFSLSGLKSGTIEAPWKSRHAAVLIFFASYCGPCKSEMPKVATYLRHHNEGSIRVIGIDAVRLARPGEEASSTTAASPSRLPSIPKAR